MIEPYYKSENVTLICADVLDALRGMADESVHMICTSPPYWGLRSYGVDGQLGLEESPDLYVQKMVEVFQEVRRVLRKDGTLWLNLGDSYNSPGPSNHGKSDIVHRGTNNDEWSQPSTRRVISLKPKDLCGIPWRVALALQADGWYLRSDIIWAKANPMPESCTDRPTKSHEYVFLLTKSAKYFYDGEAIKEDVLCAGDTRTGCYGGQTPPGGGGGGLQPGAIIGGSRNRRSVWTIPTESFPGAHFATFPRKLVEPCILAGSSAKGCCSECGAPWRRVARKQHPPTRKTTSAGPYADHGLLGGNRFDEPIQTQTLGWEPTCKHDAEIIPCTVLDPFVGSGTTLLVAQRHGRRGIGIDLSPAYLDMAVNRLGLGLVMDEAKADEAQGALDYAGAGRAE